MASSTTDCLTAADLRVLTSGDSSPDLQVRAEAHLADCERCVDQLSRLVDADRLAPLLRAAVASPVFLDSHAGDLARDIAAGLETQVASGDATRVDSAQDGDVDLSWDVAEEAEFRPPSIGPFRIIRCLGRGGMGAVFEAEDQRLMRRVALKVILPHLAADPSLRERFLREARSIAAIRHHSIVGIHEVGSDAGVPYLAMELLTGCTLEALLSKSAPLATEQVAAIGAECAAGLSAVHAQGLLHRDIKPGNIWVESLSQEHGVTRAQIKLLDFGLARPAQDSDGLTHPGVVIGTPRYLSPEQASGDALDQRSDLFSLGCVLYQMTTGAVPFDGPDVLSRLNALATIVPPRADAVNGQTPAELADLIERLLARDVARRPESASVVVDELRRIAARLRPQSQTSEPQRAGDGSRGGSKPHWLTGWTGGGAIAALLAIIIITFKDGSTVELKTYKPLEGVTVQNPGQPAIDVTPAEQPATPEAASPAATSPGVVATQAFAIQSLSPLDPASIPASERVAGQPPELVAVLGEHRMREWTSITGLAFDATDKCVIAKHDVILGPHAWSVDSFDAVPLFDIVDSPQGTPRFSRDGRFAFTHGRLSRLLADNGASRYGDSVILPAANPEFGDFSPDGRWLVTGGAAGPQLQLWDLTPPTLSPIDIGPLAAGELGRATLTVVDAPPRIVITGVAAGNQTIVYDVNWSASPVPQITDATSHPEMWFVARSAPRALAITADGKSTILDISDAPPRVVQELFPARWVADGNRLVGGISADGRLAVTSAGATVYVHREENGQWMQTDELTHAGFTNVALSSDGTKLAVAEGDGYIQLWDISKTPAVHLSPRSVATRVHQLTVSPDGRYVGVAGFDGGTIYDMTANAPQRVDGPTFADRQDGVWSFNVDPPLAVFMGGPVYDLRTSPAPPISRPVPTADMAFVPGRDEFLQWNAPTGEVALQWTPWQIDRRGTLLWETAREGLTIPPLFIDPSNIRWERGRFLATDSSTGLLHVYDFGHADAPITTVQGRPHQHKWQTLSPSGELLMQWMIGQDTIVWDLTTSPPSEYRITVPSTAGEFAPNEKYIVLEGQYGGTVVYDWQLNREVLRIPMPGPVRSFHLHPDGRHLLTVNGNGTVYILRMPDHLSLDHADGSAVLSPSRMPAESGQTVIRSEVAPPALPEMPVKGAMIQERSSWESTSAAHNLSKWRGSSTATDSYELSKR